MPASLLTTKLYIPPPRPALVPRPRLVERLNAGLDTACKLMLVSAPAGFGKTTLLSEWIYSVETAEQMIPTLFAWLSLDKGDNDPARFWAYVVAALREVRPDIGQAALAILQMPQPTAAPGPQGQANWIETILIDLINELAAAGPAPLVLVLDDLHLIENPQIHDELVFLMEHLPPHMHLVISSRADPPWPLARWRARCQVTELRSEEKGLSPWFDAIVLANEARLHLARGDIAAASRWAQANESMLNGELVLSYCSIYLVLAKTLIALNKLDEALRFLTRLLKMTEAAGARLHIVRILILQAVAWQALGTRDEALKALSRALELAEPAGMVRAIVDEGEPARMLMADLRGRSRKQECGNYVELQDSILTYMDRLLGVFHAPGPVPLSQPEIRHPASEMIEPLSKRELHVLRLLGRGLSSTEIADELVISANTARSHIKSIYGKLSVHERASALEQVKQLGPL